MLGCRLHDHLVGSWRHKFETVDPVGGRHRLGDKGVDARIDHAVPVRVLVEPHGHLIHAAVHARILRAVAVPVVEDRVADHQRSRERVAEVGDTQSPGRHRHGDRMGRGQPVGVVGAGPGAGGQRSAGGHDRHRVAAAVGADELEGAHRSGGRGGDHRAAGIAKLHRDAGEPVLACFRRAAAVAVEVVPERAADHRLEVVAEIGVEDRVAACRRIVVERHDSRSVLVAVAVSRAGTAAARQRGGRDGHGVVAAGRQSREQVEAVGVGDGVAGHAGAVAQVDAGGRRDGEGHAGHARLAGILHAVAVEVAPDEIADGSGGQHRGDVGAVLVVGALAGFIPGIGDGEGVGHRGADVGRRLEHVEGDGDHASAAGIERPEVVPVDRPGQAIGGQAVRRRAGRDEG